MRIKAEIEDEDGLSSVEFSVEEMLGHTGGRAWGEMNEEGRLHALEDYAVWLHSRQHGNSGHARVRIDRSTWP